MSRIREAKRLRQEAKEEAERLWQSILSETFPKPGTELPAGWRWVRLGEVCSKPQYGLTQAASQEPVGPKFVRITDITSGQINWETVPYCRIDRRALEKYWLAEGDLLFARSGSIGATLLIREKPPYDAVFASYLIRVRVNHSVVLPEFVDLFIKSSFGQIQLIPQGAAQKNINAKLIQQLLIPVPPLEEQHRIVAHLQDVQEKIRALKEIQAQTEAELKRLEQAILDKAFRGEL
jgi:type I restriction enzyme S subunit